MNRRQLQERIVCSCGAIIRQSRRPSDFCATTTIKAGCQTCWQERAERQLRAVLADVKPPEPAAAGDYVFFAGDPG